MVDSRLAKDIGLHAGNEAASKLFEVVETIPDPDARMGGLLVAVAAMQHKIDGFRLLLPPSYLRAYEEILATLNSTLVEEVRESTGADVS